MVNNPIEIKKASQVELNFPQENLPMLIVQGNVDLSVVLELELKIREIRELLSREHLIIIMDFRKISNIDLEARNRISQSQLLTKTYIDFIFISLTDKMRAILAFLYHAKNHSKVIDVDSYEEAQLLYQELESKYRMGAMSEGPSVLTGVKKEIIKILDKEFLMVHNKKWTYVDPKETYFYQIDLIDSNILISRPSGYIEYVNSVNANVIFDKVIFEVIGKEESYYRIQDYTDVMSTSLSARRDFTNYIIKNIDHISLMVFFGLNPVMKAIVKLGKLIHPSFNKVKIVKSFDDALKMVLEHKYGKQYFSEEVLNLKSSSKFKGRIEKEQVGQEIKALQKKYLSELDQLFQQIGGVLWSSPHEVDECYSENEAFLDVCQAIKVLKDDINEIVSKKDHTIEHMQKQLDSFAAEIKKMDRELSTIKSENQKNIEKIHYDIRIPVQNISASSEVMLTFPLGNEIKEFGNRISENSKTLLYRINQQNDDINKKNLFSNPSLGVFQIHKGFEKTLDYFIPVCNQKNLMLKYENNDLADYYIGDQDKINTIIEHFIDNAIRYTQKGSIVLRTRVMENLVTQHQLRIEVSDTGTGIGPELEGMLHQHINNDISIGDTKKLINKYWGNGLKLSKQLAEMLGGEIGFHRNENGGAIFYLDIRLSLGSFSKELNLLKRSSKLKTIKPINDQSFKTLLLKDDVLSNDMEIKLFWKLEISLEMANGKEHAIQLIKNTPFDLILLTTSHPEKFHQIIKDLIQHIDPVKTKFLILSTSPMIAKEDFQVEGLSIRVLLVPYSLREFLDIIKKFYRERFI